MRRHLLWFPLVAAAFALPEGKAAGALSRYSDLYGSHCTTLASAPGVHTRRCSGVAGYHLLVHEVQAQTSVDILTPRGQVWPLDFWEVVTPGLARVGRKAEWRMERRGAALVPVALLVRLDSTYAHTAGPRMAPGAILAAARIAADGACVVYHGNAAAAGVIARARLAVQGRPACLGIYRAQGS